MMHQDINTAIIRHDEAITFNRVEPLNDTLNRYDLTNHFLRGIDIVKPLLVLVFRVYALPRYASTKPTTEKKKSAHVPV